MCRKVAAYHSSLYNPSPYQTIAITRALVNLFATMGMPDILHFDQGRTLRVLCLSRLLMHLDYKSHIPQPTTLKGCLHGAFQPFFAAASMHLM